MVSNEKKPYISKNANKSSCKKKTIDNDDLQVNSISNLSDTWKLSLQEGANDFRNMVMFEQQIKEQASREQTSLPSTFSMESYKQMMESLAEKERRLQMEEDRLRKEKQLF